MKVDWRRIADILKKFSSINDVRAFFVEQLNFALVHISIDKFPEGLASEIIEAGIIAHFKDFHIIAIKLKKLLKGNERRIINDITKTYYHSLVIFTDENETEFHFTNQIHIEKAEDIPYRPFRRIIVGKTERLRTAAEKLSLIYAGDNDTALDLHLKCDAAFDVQSVSKEFYNDFVQFYKHLRKTIMAKNKMSLEKADRFTQTIFNRLFFLYFIQKKRYLERDYFYLVNRLKEFENKENYYKDVLIPLFRKLSDKNFSKKDFENTPFLNGGLFEFDEKEKGIAIPNDEFSFIIGDFFEKYNFTIREDTDFEQEVAIDPEMLGTIFEQLILGLEEKNFKDIKDTRKGTGSYYTPRFIVSFMVKQSIINYLLENDKTLNKKDVIPIVFHLDTSKISNNKLEDIKESLLRIKILDPAVGSGAFPVGFLLKLVEIIEEIDRRIEGGIKVGADYYKPSDTQYRYYLKREFIEGNIFGVDIQKRAVELANVRLWLSLIVDLNVSDIKDIPPLPNLDYKIMLGNSLYSKLDEYGIDIQKPVRLSVNSQKILERFRKKKEDFSAIPSREGKKKAREDIQHIKRDFFEMLIKEKEREDIETVKKEERKEISYILSSIEFSKEDKELKNKKKKEIEEIYTKRIDEIKEQTKIALEREDEIVKQFTYGLDFYEVVVIEGGFDVVIGNPPYGVDVENKVKEKFELQKKDSYGVFTALAINLAKYGGTITFIMSDTFQTIKTHYPLRKKILENCDIKHLISVPKQTFKQTVNVGVYVFRKRKPSEEDNKWIIAADFSPLAIKKGELEIAFEQLSNLEISGNITERKIENKKWFHIAHFNDEIMGFTAISDRRKAVFAYKQAIIKLFSNLSLFIASPKLFLLMQDVGNKKTKPYTDEKGKPILFNIKGQKNLFEKKGPEIYQVNFNDKVIELVKLGDVAEVKQGLATGDNHYYLRQLPDTRGNYKETDLSLILKENELEKIRKDGKLRLDVIENGICTNSNHKTHKHRYFGGRYFVPYDKGGASDIEEGWLPNYYVPTDYFIDWSEESVKRMKTLTIADVYKKQGKSIPSGKEYYKKQIAAVFRNIDTYFKKGITFSDTGFYAPSYRFNSSTIYDVMGMSIFTENPHTTIALLTSKISKYFIKNFINATVHSQVEGVKKIPLFLKIQEENKEKLTKLVFLIIEHQKQYLKYNYMTNEQIAIDRLIYNMYNLNEEDIWEVENWYFRRYPKLAEVIEGKLNKERQ